MQNAKGKMQRAKGKGQKEKGQKEKGKGERKIFRSPRSAGLGQDDSRRQGTQKAAGEGARATQV